MKPGSGPVVVGGSFSASAEDHVGVVEGAAGPAGEGGAGDGDEGLGGGGLAGVVGVVEGVHEGASGWFVAAAGS
jgi:hypothetical protein